MIMKKDLDLEIGDLVVYPSYGVGEIEKFDKFESLTLKITFNVFLGHTVP